MVVDPATLEMGTENVVSTQARSLQPPPGYTFAPPPSGSYTQLKYGIADIMIKGKDAYLKRLTASLKMRSVDVGRFIEGSTPPSVFVGSWNYPKVYAGPMIAPVHGDTAAMDSPETWIPDQKTQEEIVGYRLSLVRGKRRLRVDDLDDLLVEKLQEIALASTSVESEAQFARAPKGRAFCEEETPFGPSAPLERFETEGTRWDGELEKVYYDGDLAAADAVTDLHRRDVPVSRIQKAFSIGCMGRERRRRLVPTRWAITACDSIIGGRLLEEVRHHEPIDIFRVHEFSSLNNYYAVLLLPTAWQYEWTEAFMHVLGHEEMVFSDYEGNRGRKGYSSVGGCYYSCKMAVLEALAREKRQAGAVIFREAYRGYVPLGVFNVRENVRCAMGQPPTEFEDARSALSYLSTKLCLPIRRFVEEGDLLRDILRPRQTTLDCF